MEPMTVNEALRVALRALEHDHTEEGRRAVTALTELLAARTTA